jgi:hypothetical protein
MEGTYHSCMATRRCCSLICVLKIFCQCFKNPRVRSSRPWTYFTALMSLKGLVQGR